MQIMEFVLILATLLCSLVAGFVFAFAVVVMPGIAKLEAREFIRAFQVVDGVIQNNQPVFILVWVGSILALALALLLGVSQLAGGERLLLVVAASTYFFGVQLPTFRINIPLNNKLQTLDLDGMDETSARTARNDFEPRWNRWNSIRTAFASLAAALLMTLLIRL